ncbi:MAG: NADH-ubiquinone oxidoreductase subunit NDUFA12 family protein [Holosporales bacterium]
MLQMKWKTWRYGKLVGTDAMGNRYYEDRRGGSAGGTPQRWVIFAKGAKDPTTIPVEWFGWLHYSHEAPLEDSKAPSWQKPRLTNKTGTPEAYRPPMPSLTKDRSAPNAAYVPWHPD